MAILVTGAAGFVALNVLEHLLKAGRGDYTLSRDIAAGPVAIADQPSTPRTIYNLATGRGSTVEDWCRVLETRLPGFAWRRAAAGEVWNVESHTGFDRGAMDIGRITADTPYRPDFDLDRAADHLLAWWRG